MPARSRWIVDGQARCSMCKAMKPASDFWANSASPIGLSSHCKPCDRKHTKKWSDRKPELRKAQAARANAKKKERVLAAYGGPLCVCCGITDPAFLCIDHINGGGGAHRRQVGKNFYWWLIRNNFPSGFQVLCYNCNMGKRDGATCPHKR